MDGSGNVYVLELLGRRVQKLTNGGSYLMTIGSAGSGPGQFVDPVGIGLDASGRVHVADYTRLRILRFPANGAFDMEFSTPVPRQGRRGGGCAESDNNSTDFSAGAPAPRNTATPLSSCSPTGVSARSWGQLKIMSR